MSQSPEPRAENLLSGTCSDGCCAAPNEVEPERRQLLIRRVRWLVAATIIYNVIEAIIAISAGTIRTPPR